MDFRDDVTRTRHFLEHAPVKILSQTKNACAGWYAKEEDTYILWRLLENMWSSSRERVGDLTFEQAILTQVSS